VLTELVLHGMAVRMELSLMLRQDPLPPDIPPSPLDVRRIRHGRAGEHVEIAAAGLGLPPDVFAEVMTDDVLDLPSVRCYLGTVGDAAVCTGLGAVHAGWLGVFNVATPEAHRRRGYAAAMTARIIEDALAVGTTRAYLQAGDPELGVYQRLGFSTVETWSVWM
jgi:GNAT superfamily N-acetyltransferase